MPKSSVSVPSFLTSSSAMVVFDPVDPQPELRAIVWGCQSCGWREDPDERKPKEGEWHPPTVCPLCDTRGMKGIRGLSVETWEELTIRKSWSPFADEEDDEEGD
jgi:hypothetical protein